MATAAEIIARLIPAFAADLVNEDETVTSEIARTNATGFGWDTHEVTAAAFTAPDRIVFIASLRLVGELDPEKPAAGDALHVELDGVAEIYCRAWSIMDYTIIRCERRGPGIEGG